jgi:chaperonin GroES
MSMYEQIDFEPLADFLLIDPIPRGTTPGGLALPDGADPDPPKGKVVKVGPGRISEEGVRIEHGLKPGDTVYMCFAYSQPLQITFAGHEYAVVRARDVIAKAE